MGDLYWGDNLDILRNYIPTESIDLIYLWYNRSTNATTREGSGMERSCEICGATFSPKRREQRFCSRDCSTTWTIANRRSYAGDANPNYGKPRPDHVKDAVRRARTGSKASTATRQKMSESRRGKPKSPEWRAAISESLRANPAVSRRGEANANFRHGEFVDERVYREMVDLSACSECGVEGVILEVHHRDGDHFNNTIDNLQVLCKRCHGKKHGRPKRVAS